MKEFAFDVKLFAVARVTAKTEKEARAKLHNVVDCLDVGYDGHGVKITEASNDGTPELIEIDGEAV